MTEQFANSLPEEPIIRSEPSEVASRVFELFGLRVEVFIRAAALGQRYALDTTRNDVNGMSGYLLWGKTHRGLTDEVALTGEWEFDQKANYPTIINEERRVAIVVWNGDKFTGVVPGDPDESPAPRRPKGDETKSVVERNVHTLFDSWYFDRGNFFQTWVLLVYVDRQAGELRLELSLPCAISSNGAVATWRERLVIGSRPLTDGVADAAGDNPDLPVIEVSRRNVAQGNAN